MCYVHHTTQHHTTPRRQRQRQPCPGKLPWQWQWSVRVVAWAPAVWLLESGRDWCRRGPDHAVPDSGIVVNLAARRATPRSRAYVGTTLRRGTHSGRSQQEFRSVEAAAEQAERGRDSHTERARPLLVDRRDPVQHGKKYAQQIFSDFPLAPFTVLSVFHVNIRHFHAATLALLHTSCRGSRWLAVG
jgi:hypothetical protein